MWSEDELSRGDERFDSERDRRLQEQEKRRTIQPTMAAADFKKTAKEADILKGCRDVLNLLHVPHSLTDASRTHDKEGKVRAGKVDQGWPDLSGTLPWPPNKGRSLYVETKTAKGGYQPGQREIHAILKEAGAVVLVPRSVEAFVRMLYPLASIAARALLSGYFPDAFKDE